MVQYPEPSSGSSGGGGSGSSGGGGGGGGTIRGMHVVCTFNSQR